jgi:hypothetical protein
MRGAKQRCARHQLAQFMRARFRDARAAAAAEQDAAGDPGTGLLEAFEGLEPGSSVSQMAVAPPMPEEVDDDLLQTADPGDEADEADTNPPQAPEPMHAVEAGDASGPEDEPTRVVAYTSTASGELAEERKRPRRDAPVHEHVAAPEDTTAARRHRSSPSHAHAGMPGPASEPALPALTPLAEPLREGIAQSSMDWDEDDLSTHIYDAPEGGAGAQHALAPPPIEAPVQHAVAWEEPREAPEPRALSTSPRARIPTLRPMPSDPVPSASRVTTLRPSAPVLAHDVAITPAVASIRPAAVSSAAPTPRVASMRPMAAPAAVSRPPAAERSIPRASRTLSTTRRTAAMPWSSEGDPARRPRAIAIAAAAVCVLVALAVLLIGRPSEPATIHVATEPLDASVTLDGVEVAGSTSPFVFTHVTPDVPHVVEVSKPGYRSWSTTLTLRSGRELNLPVVRLARDASAAPPALPAARSAQAPTGAQRPVPAVHASPRVAPAPAPRRPAPSPARAPRSAKRSQPSRAAAPPRAPAPAAAAQPSHIVTVAPVSRTDVGTGKLRINSRPWSQVYVDGRLIGNTPRTDVVLSAGVHTVTLIAPDFGYKRVLSVPIKRGETVTKIVDLAN